ncbi:gastrula zinc finger protein XlCGF8.2DB-like [Esox lucius]|uniref:gastrula zinc finger protein XlCGF8.2DB-like n=1 Tax=Esox lucius TaxID=8010 RepID=UPI001476B096|nr:gastrula zinc finger protein XlCGF8.2DB-like [Esox lucius]
MKTEPEGGEGYGGPTKVTHSSCLEENAHCSAAQGDTTNGHRDRRASAEWKTKRGRTLQTQDRNSVRTDEETCFVRAIPVPRLWKGFPARKGLADHMTTHTGERPHSCHLCGKGFKVKSHLNEHIRVHTGEKPFVCPVCGKAFRQDAHMKGHLRRTHKEKPYRCHDCGESFSQMGELQVHRTVCCGPTGLGF